METNNQLQTTSNSGGDMMAVGNAIMPLLEAARQYPRNIKASVEEATMMATLDEETAEGCFYHLERKAKDGSKNIIEGPSVRLAEIMKNAYGRILIETGIVEDVPSHVIVYARATDLEKLTSTTIQVKRNTVTSYGQPYNADMRTIAMNAAMAIAKRNAVLDVIPKAFANNIVKRCKEMVQGAASQNLRDTVQKMVGWFAKQGVTAEMLCEKCEVESIDAITAPMVADLKGIATALKDNTTTVEDEFPQLRQQPAEGKMQGKVEKLKKAAAKKNPAEMSEEEIEAAMSEEQTKLKME
jgi:hypothetical protein